MLATQANIVRFKSEEDNLSWLKEELLQKFVTEFAWWLFMEYREHKFTIKIWIFRKTLKIADLEGVFELLFGENPYEDEGAVL